MTFTAPLGLLALLAIPAIVAIHLFRRRFPSGLSRDCSCGKSSSKLRKAEEGINKLPSRRA